MVMSERAVQGAAQGSWEIQVNLGVRPKEEGTGKAGKDCHEEEK